MSGTGTGGRILKDDVLGYVDGNGGGDGATATAAAPTPAAAEVQPIRGPDAALARYMEASREIPTATSFRTLSVATLDGRRRQLNDALKAAQREMKVSFTHLIGYAIAQAWKTHPTMGHAFQQDNGKPQRVISPHVNLGLAVDVQRKDGGRTLIVPVIKQADTLDFAGFREVYEDLIGKTRDGSLSPDDMQGANITLTNPGGIGTVASVPRLMPGQGTIVATGAITWPPGLADAGPARLVELGVSKVMTMTSTYDHRVIQGAESGAFLGRIEELLRGADGFYEEVFRSFGLEPPAAPPKTAPTAPAGPAAERPSEEMLSHVQAATSLIKAHRMHGHLAAHLDPLGSEPIGDPALEPATVGLTPEVMEQIPAHILRIQCPGATLAEALPHLRAIYTRHDRLRDRAHLRPPEARLAAAADRVGQVPAAAVARGAARGARAPDRCGGARDLPAPVLPRLQELLDRGARRVDPDARRDLRPGGRRGREGGVPGNGAPRPAERARARGRAARTRRSWPSSRARRTST